MSVRNARTMPEVYYGLHMVEGTAEYAEPGKTPTRIYIGEDTIKNMNPSFQGKPVYVDHVDEVDLDNIQEEADGYVIDSFYNKSDGKNWCKFLVVSDKGKAAIRNGWRLSNCYIPNTFGSGGENHGVAFSKEVMSAEYEHLAIVKDPRYEESIILTPEQFKEYNAEKEAEIMRLANSKENQKEKKMGFKLFKKTKVENSADIEGMSVRLEKSGKEMLLSDVVTEYDKIMNMHGYANAEHMVKVGENEMSVGDLVKKHVKMSNAEKERLEKEEEMKNAGEGEPGVEIEDCHNDEDEEGTVDSGEHDVDSRGGDESLENEGADDMPDQSEEHSEEKKREKKKEGVKNKLSYENALKVVAREKARRLANAHLTAAAGEEVATVDMSLDKVARGVKRYGSN